MPEIMYEVTGGFFNSVRQDRLYSAEQMNMPYKRIVSDGIFPDSNGTPSGDFLVSLVSGMVVSVAAGNAIVGGKWAESAEPVEITVAGNTSELARIDSIVLRADTSASVRAIGIVYKQGTESANPSAPAIVSDGIITEIRLADITVQAGASSLLAANIVDQRGGTECPWVAGVIPPTQAQVSTAVDAYLQENPDALNIDSALSDSSTNAVQNKVVKAAIDEKYSTASASTDLAKVSDTVMYLYSGYDFGEMSVGGLNGTTGQANSPSWRCRTEMTPTRKRMVVRLNNPAYTLLINLYSKFKDRNSFTRSVTETYVDGSLPIPFECGVNDKYYMIAVNRIDQTSMTTDLTDPTSDWSIIKNELKVYFINETLTETQDVFKSVTCKTAKTIQRYADNDGRLYNLQGLCVTPKYVVFSCNSISTTDFPDDEDRLNAFFVLDKDTLETADLPENPVIIDFGSGDYPIVTSHANSLTYYPDGDEIYVREIGSYHYMTLDAETFAVKTFGSMPISGGFAYDQTSEQWAYLYYTQQTEVFNIHIYSMDRTQLITRLDPKRQGIIQGIGFFDNMVFIPASGTKGNSIIVVDTLNNVIASWWFTGGGEFEDIDKFTENSFILGANDNGTYKLYVGVYRPFNVYYSNIKAWEDYQNSSIVE